MASSTVGVKLDEETKQRLKTLGKNRKRTPHWLMKSAITEYLEREEKIEAQKQEDMERWREYKLTGESLSNQAMMGWLDDLEKEIDHG
ncbi:MAG: toxin-antitoxin system [Deltaproteobacteria bacterium]|nr:toxin-antitoxin system [Deltaproteobacteria bacterium]